MCDPVEAFPPCRAKQLFDASERVIDMSRRLAHIPIAASFAEVAEKIAELKKAVAVFDRLNRGMMQGERDG